MKPSIVVVGSLNMDFVVRTAHLPVPGETVLGSDFQMIPGGKGGNQACAAGRAGAGTVAVKMVGRVGYDMFGDHLKASLAADGVDVSSVHGAQGQPTGIAMIWVDQQGRNSIVVASGANHAIQVSECHAMRAVIHGAHSVLFQLETPLAVVATALDVARDEGALTILDPAPAQALPRVLLGCVSILTPNESEALALLGRPPGRVSANDAPELASAILDLGVESVILKLGEQGCFYANGEIRYQVPGFSVQAVDTTAAGDTFNGALAVSLALGRPMRDALRFANAAAAISVTKMGAQASIPLGSDIEHFISRTT